MVVAVAIIRHSPFAYRFRSKLQAGSMNSVLQGANRQAGLAGGLLAGLSSITIERRACF